MGQVTVVQDEVPGGPSLEHLRLRHEVPLRTKNKNNPACVLRLYGAAGWIWTRETQLDKRHGRQHSTDPWDLPKLVRSRPNFTRAESGKRRTAQKIYGGLSRAKHLSKQQQKMHGVRDKTQSTAPFAALSCASTTEIDPPPPHLHVAVLHRLLEALGGAPVGHGSLPQHGAVEHLHPRPERRRRGTACRGAVDVSTRPKPRQDAQERKRERSRPRDQKTVFVVLQFLGVRIETSVEGFSFDACLIKDIDMYVCSLCFRFSLLLIFSFWQGRERMRKIKAISSARFRQSGVFPASSRKENLCGIWSQL